jgi:hypothetical protein
VSLAHRKGEASSQTGEIRVGETRWLIVILSSIIGQLKAGDFALPSPPKKAEQDGEKTQLPGGTPSLRTSLRYKKDKLIDRHESHHLNCFVWALP